jgi:hypothetical protein
LEITGAEVGVGEQVGMIGVKFAVLVFFVVEVMVFFVVEVMVFFVVEVMVFFVVEVMVVKGRELNSLRKVIPERGGNELIFHFVMPTRGQV